MTSEPLENESVLGACAVRDWGGRTIAKLAGPAITPQAVGLPEDNPTKVRALEFPVKAKSALPLN